MLMWRLAIREVRDQLSSSRTWLAIAAAALMAALTVSLGAQDFLTRRTQHSERLARERESTPTAPPLGKFWGEAIEPRLRAHRAPFAASVIARGIEPSLPSYYDFSPAGVVTGPSDSSSLQTSEIAPIADLEAIVRILLGFGAIMIAIESVAGDRSSGVLAALMAQPVSRMSVMASKYTGVLVTLLVATIVTVSVAVGSLAASSAGVLNAEFMWLLPVFCGLSAVYLSTLLGVGMVIGSIAGSHRRALAIGLAVWALIAIGAPQLTTFVSRTLTRETPRVTIEERLKAQSISRARETRRAIGRAFPPNPPKFSADLSPETKVLAELAFQSEQKLTRQTLDGWEKTWADGQLLQNDRVRQLSWITPATTYLQIAVSLADTGRATEVRWNSAVQRRQRTLNQQLFDDPPRCQVDLPTGEAHSLPRHDPVGIDDLGRFTAPVATLRDRARDARSELLVLAVQFIASLALAVVSFPRAGF